MNLAANKARLMALGKDLRVKWDQTKESWRDTKSQEFERHYLEPLLASMDKTVTVIDQLDKIITKVRSDCE
jgi:hypothetical protein